MMAAIRKALTSLAAVLLVMLALASSGQAQSDRPVGPSISEQQLLQELQKVQGRVSIPDQRSATLIQPAGRDWQAFRTDRLPWIGGTLVLGMLGLLAVFYLVRGRIRLLGGFSGRTLLRFNSLERFVHWMTASCFIVLGLSGLNISLGRIVLLPLIGPDAFTLVSQWGKYAHNFLAVPFVLGIVLMLVIWIKDNLPSRLDVAWIAAGGGIVGGGHPPARRFNAGQKLIFWSVILGGAALAVTGTIMMFPFQWTDVTGMQLATVVHALIGVVIVAVMLAHIYIGTIGMEGAFDAMGSGEVDRNWAKSHHSLWVEEIESGRRDRPSAARAMPAE